MRYARQMVAEREMPAWQCTSTRPPLFFTESAREMGGIRREGGRGHWCPSPAPELLPSEPRPLLTNEAYGLLEPGTDLHHLVVLHRDALVAQKALKVVGAAGGDVEDGSDAAGLQPLQVR